jgi:hypothetical protein
MCTLFYLYGLFQINTASFLTTIADVYLALMLRIRKVPGSNLGPETRHSD